MRNTRNAESAFFLFRVFSVFRGSINSVLTIPRISRFGLAFLASCQTAVLSCFLQAQYKRLSAEIRTLRLGNRFHQRSRHPDLALSPAEQRYVADASALCESAQFNSALAAFHRRRRSICAAEMLAELKEARVEAQRQYQAGKATAMPDRRDASH